jgi:hypothetical protein
MFVLAMSVIAFAASHVQAQNGSTFRSSGRLFGGGIEGRVTFEAQTRGGEEFRLFRVDIDNGPPLQVVPIIVNGTLVAAPLLNPAGRGRVVMRSAAFFNGEGMLMPSNFPMLRTRDVVRVGTGIGLMFDRRGGHGIAAPPPVQMVRIRGTLPAGGAGAMTGTIEFRARSVQGQPLDRSFIVDLANAPPNEDVLIRVGQTVIAVVPADANGVVSTQMQTGAINSPTGAPLLNDFPTLTSGNVMNVGGSHFTMQPVGVPVP